MIERIKKFVMRGEKEKEVVNMIQEHIGLIIDACELMKTIIEQSDKAVVGDICEVEKMGDAIRRDVMIKIHSGAFIPALRPDFCRLAEELDEILDELEDIAMLFLSIKRIPDDMRGDFVRVAEINSKMSKHLLNAFNSLESGNPDNIEDIFLKIKISEEEVDSMKGRIYQKLPNAKLEGYVEWYFFIKFVEKLLNVSNLIEDAADIIQMLSVSIR